MAWFVIVLLSPRGKVDWAGVAKTLASRKQRARADMRMMKTKKAGLRQARESANTPSRIKTR